MANTPPLHPLAPTSTTKNSYRSLSGSWRRAEGALNRAVADSSIGHYFLLNTRKSTFTKELRAGTVTFLTMVYIISVNATILADSGGPCNINHCSTTNFTATNGPECKFNNNPGYMNCLSDTKKDIVVATVLIAMAGSFAMGVFANLPLALAPGMGANAYFTYNMVGFHGSGPLKYNEALAAVMLEGIVFLVLSVLGLRSKLSRLIPNSIRLASAAGIGLFLAFTGLQAQNGVGLVGPSKSTLVALTACADTNPITGECSNGVLTSPTFWLGAAGFVLTACLLAHKIKGSIIYGIVLVTAISWFRNSSFTFFPSNDIGDSNYEYFKHIVDFHVIRSTAGQISLHGLNNRHFWFAVLTILYVDVLNTTGAMYSMAEYGGFTDEKGGFEGEYKAFIVDASSTIVGSALGTTTVTTFIESTAGMKEGGRTGITAITVASWFLLSLFFTPLFTSVPAWAIGPAMVVVGAMMMKLVKDIEWGEMKEGLPAFVTLILMPLTYSIANGIVGGIGVYLAVHSWDYGVKVWKWGMKLKMMCDNQNQVCVDGVSVAQNSV